MLKYFAFSILFYTSLFVKGNDSTFLKNYIEIATDIGYIFKHSPKYKPPVTEPTFGLDFSYNFQKKTQKPYLYKLKNPYIGLGFLYINYGDDYYYGNAYGALGYLNFKIKDSKKIKFGLKSGIGLGYITRKHSDVWTNNIIGSNLNFLLQLKGITNFQLSPNFNLNTSIGINHISNGHTTMPNLGINYCYIQLGTKLFTNRNDKNKSFEKDTQLLSKLNNQIIIGLGISDRGNQEIRAILPNYSINYQKYFPLSFNDYLIGGLSFAYKNDEVDYKVYEYWKNAEFALLGGYELLLGKTSIYGILGLYTYPIGQYDRFVYQKYGFNYRLLQLNKDIFLTFGGAIKTHFGAAELIESRIAFNF